MRLYGKDYPKSDISALVGAVSQLGAIRRTRLVGGKADGLEVAEIRAGSLNFDVLLGRGMDIGYAEYKGIPLAWRSPTGEVGPAFFEPEGLGWLRSFHGGLVVTCGLTYMGAPSEDGGKSLGLHGRASNTPAEDVCTGYGWEGASYKMWVEGSVREVAVFGENLKLTRRVSCELGGNSLLIEDTVENLGFERTEHMQLYHINIGFPVLDRNAKLVSRSVEVIPRDRDAEEGKERYAFSQAPTPGYREKVYYHKMDPDGDGNVWAALVNPGLMRGMGVYVKYAHNELPYFVQWKMMGMGAYVMGLEPANALVEGRAGERACGRLRFLEPGEKRVFRLEVGVLEGAEAIDELYQRVRCAVGGSAAADGKRETGE